MLVLDYVGYFHLQRGDLELRKKVKACLRCCRTIGVDFIYTDKIMEFSSLSFTDSDFRDETTELILLLLLEILVFLALLAEELSGRLNLLTGADFFLKLAMTKPGPQL